MTIVRPEIIPCGCALVYGVLHNPLEALVGIASDTCPHHRSGDTLPVQTHSVIVTGSRKWTDTALIYADLEHQLAYAQSVRSVLVVCHGKNPKGADAIAAQWCKERRGHGVVEDPVPADWTRDCDTLCSHKPRVRADGTRWCPAAGVLRNQVMVDKGAALCLAYPLDGTGTQDCMKRADAAGIPVCNRASG